MDGWGVWIEGELQPQPFGWFMLYLQSLYPDKASFIASVYATIEAL